MTINEMIPGQRYMAGDGYGYEYVWCVGQPTEEEITEVREELDSGYYVKIRYEDNGKYDIWFESYDYLGHIYCEPA